MYDITESVGALRELAQREAQTKGESHSGPLDSVSRRCATFVALSALDSSVGSQSYAGAPRWRGCALPRAFELRERGSRLVAAQARLTLQTLAQHDCDRSVTPHVVHSESSCEQVLDAVLQTPLTVKEEQQLTVLRDARLARRATAWLLLAPALHAHQGSVVQDDEGSDDEALSTVSRELRGAPPGAALFAEHLLPFPHEQHQEVTDDAETACDEDDEETEASGTAATSAAPLGAVHSRARVFKARGVYFSVFFSFVTHTHTHTLSLSLSLSRISLEYLSRVFS